MNRNVGIIVLAALAAAACVAAPSTTRAPAALATGRSTAPGATRLAGEALSPTIVPWTSASPAASPAPTDSGWPIGPPCRPDQLAISSWLADDTTALGGYTIWNDADAPCSIGRGVAVAILDATGQPIPVSTRIASPGPICGGTGGQCPPPGPTPPPWIFMPPSGPNAQDGGDSGTVAWTSWCGTPPVQPLSLLVTLGDGTRLRTPGISVGIPPCTDASRHSVLELTRVEVGGAWPTEPPAIPADSLKAALEVPGPATAGRPLDYVLVLSNPTASAVTLSPCPTYQERLNAVGGPVVEEHILNCADVGPIGPGESIRFAMVLDVPAWLPASSDAALVWILDPDYGQGFAPPINAPGVKVPLSVVLP